MNGVRDSFSQLVVALEPWLDQVVIIGGWANQLYRRHPAALELNYPPLMTLDTDIAVPLKLPVRGTDIRARLLTHGFKEEFLGDDLPPAAHYHLGDEASGFYVEFLSPLIGGEYDRKGRRKATAELAGIVSQRLRYVDLLLHHPWSIDFKSSGFAAVIQIANPVTFVAQKVLIHEGRERDDRAKDILYIHDTLEVFGARLQELRELWRRIVVPQLRARNASIVSNASQVLFGDLSDDIRRAARISDQRTLSPESIREVCQYGFIQVFG